MKYIYIFMVILFANFEGSAQSKIMGKWSGETSVGLGYADFHSENFENSGNVSNLNVLVNYNPTHKVRLSTGIGLSYFSNGSLNSTGGFSNVKAKFLEIPLKVRFMVIKPQVIKTKFFFGFGFQASKSISYQLKNEIKTFESKSGVWHFSMPLEVGIEFPLNNTYDFGIYYGGIYAEKKSNKNYILSEQQFLRLSLVCNF